MAHGLIGKQRYEQRGHIRQVVTRIGKQTHRVGHETVNGLDYHISSIKYNAEYQSFPHRHRAGVESIVVVMM